MSDEQTYEKREAESKEGAERTRPGVVYVPPVDIIEREDVVTVIADMPGVDENSVDVTLEKETLTIRGNAADHSPEGLSPVSAEYPVGDFERTFRVSAEVDPDGITAGMKHGVLTVRLPTATRSRTIKVTAE